MAIIQKIRDKYAKLAGGVIAVSLIAFVLNDAFNGSSGSIFSDGNALAKVNGESIDPLEYEKRVREYNTVYTISNQGKQITDEIRTQIAEQSLRDIINEKIINKQLEKLGITFSVKEEKELVYGANPSPMIMQYPVFINQETGMFDPGRIKAYEDQLNNPPQNADPNLIQKEKENWENYKSFAIHQAKIQKFTNLLAASLYSPKYMVDAKMAEQNELASVQIVKIPASVIPDNEVPVTDADIKAYMDKNKKRFRIDQEIRGIEYVAFDVVPSAEDTLNTANALSALKGEFATTVSVEDFVNKYSDNTYNKFYFTKKSFSSSYSDSILPKPAGAVFGPYIEGTSFVLARVVEHRMMPDSVKAQHILVQPNQNMDDSAAHKMADSLKLALDNGANFDSLALKYSADNSNNQTGGDLGYFAYGTMVPEFNEFCFIEGKTGEKKVVKTRFGYHIVKINDQKDMQAATQVAFIVRSLAPSETTETDIYARANEFANKYKTSFEAGVKAMNLQKRQADNVTVSGFSVQGLGGARDLVRWMFDAKQNDVSEVIKISNETSNRYIIARLVNVQPKGTLTINDAIRPEIESIVRAEKKAEKIAEKYKSQTSLDAIAQAGNQQVLSADSFSFTSPYLNNVGYEPKAIGFAFSKQAKPGVLSPAIKGQDGGVSYMVLTNKFTVPANPNQAAVFQQQMMMQEQQSQRSVYGAIQEMLLRKSSVKYYNDNIR